MLTLPSLLAVSLAKASIEVVVLVEFIDTNEGNSYRFTNTTNHQLDNISSACLSNMRPVTASIDPLSRKFSRSNYTLIFNDDPALRSLVSGILPGVVTYTPFKNTECEIKLGTSENQEADFITVEHCLVSDYFIQDAAIHIDAISRWYSLIADSIFSGIFVNDHPLDAMTRLLTSAGVPTGWYDATSVATSTYATIEHWNISRFNAGLYMQYNFNASDADGNVLSWAGVDKTVRGQPVSGLIDELSELMTGSFRPNATGTYSFSRFDVSGASVRTLSQDDVSDLRQLSSTEDYSAQLALLMGTENDGSSIDFNLINNTAVGQLNNFTDATGSSTAAVSIRNDWIYPVGTLYFSLNGGGADPDHVSSTDTEMAILGGGMPGICGAAFPGQDAVTTAMLGTIPTARRLSSSKYAYFLIVGERGFRKDDTGGTLDANPTADEIVRVDDMTMSAAATLVGSNHTTTRYDAPNEDGDPKQWPGPQYRIPFQFDTAAANNGRAQFSSTTPNYWLNGALVYDVTIAIDMLQARLGRVANGVARVECTLSMKHADLQPGDIVQLSHDQVLAYGIDGSDLGVWWEVLSTEVRPLEDSPGVRVVLGYLRGASNGITLDTPSYEVGESTGPGTGGGDDPLTQNDLTVITDDTLETMYPG